MWEEYKKSSDALIRDIYIGQGIDSSKFSGSVLYVGLGTCVLPKLQSINVIKTTIIEIDQAVITWNLSQGNLKKEWVVFCSDAKKFTPDEKFDIIVLSMWFQPVMAKEVLCMEKKYNMYLKPGGKLLRLNSIIKK